eukprot:TRINITY_DN11015_c0_g1_i1.p1 TRINITY_DN11015_c0_g1~~TRINITY_DN11015_c0_g1_i1.p1  ORF type:complete len:459 (-),score=68.90 TRINITY_DN11015_c0_g1_i1:5-1219(-)
MEMLVTVFQEFSYVEQMLLRRVCKTFNEITATTVRDQILDLSWELVCKSKLGDFFDEQVYKVLDFLFTKYPPSGLTVDLRVLDHIDPVLAFKHCPPLKHLKLYVDKRHESYYALIFLLNRSPQLQTFVLEAEDAFETGSFLERIFRHIWELTLGLKDLRVLNWEQGNYMVAEEFGVADVVRLLNNLPKLEEFSFGMEDDNNPTTWAYLEGADISEHTKLRRLNIRREIDEKTFRYLFKRLPNLEELKTDSEAFNGDFDFDLTKLRKLHAPITSWNFLKSPSEIEELTLEGWEWQSPDKVFLQVGGPLPFDCLPKLQKLTLTDTDLPKNFADNFSLFGSQLKHLDINTNGGYRGTEAGARNQAQVSDEFLGQILKSCPLAANRPSISPVSATKSEKEMTLKSRTE